MTRHRYEQGRATAVPPFTAAIGFAFGVFGIALSVLLTAVLTLA